ncbi:LytR/AlgR family response regulator transcription factor [Oleiharenicola sp. Vm1]|uniref:LytR/AlgR family response regulator transcription factor n=1 Tax=Oleiharenicola sp. Vm1 TaxID=3398393 RepID=UPI0039F599A6
MNPSARTLLIDDEEPARDDLRRALLAHPHVAIVGEAGRFPEAQAALQRDDYDLVLLDIQLRGGNGFDLVPLVRPGARIIFVTAHDQYALRAFAVNALDYLLKPVQADRLGEALRRVAAVAPDPSTNALRADDVVHVKTGPGSARFVRVSDIAVISSQDNYSEVRLATGEHFLVRQTLAAWEARLPASHFLRVHRQYVVNLLRIDGYTHLDEETTALRVASAPDSIRARRAHWPELLTRLAALGRKL